MLFKVVGVVLIAGLVGVILGYTAIGPWLADIFVSLIFGSNKNATVRPQYSMADTKYKQGKYQEALDEYRKVLVQYPDDVFAHVRIAEVLIQHFQKPGEAALQLEMALPNTRKGENRAFLLNRLADVYLDPLKDYARARTALEKIRVDMPDSIWSGRAEKRIESLHQVEQGLGPREHFGKDGERGYSVDLNQR